jgi:hypothetical protein
MSELTVLPKSFQCGEVLSYHPSNLILQFTTYLISEAA